MAFKARVKKQYGKGNNSGSGEGGQGPRRQHRKGGRVNRFEPLNTKELMASPMTFAYFQEVDCFDFCERVQQVQSHLELTRHFILNLHDHQVNLAGVNFELSTNTISLATGIPSMGEKWFKQENLDLRYYQYFLKPRYQADCKSIFLFHIYWRDMRP